MENRKFMIDKIPVVLYGETFEKCFLYIHGKLGFKEEAESFAEIACTKGWQVLSIDLPEHGEFLPMVMDSGELYQVPHCHEVNRDLCHAAGFADYGLPVEFLDADMKRTGII